MPHGRSYSFESFPVSQEIGKWWNSLSGTTDNNLFSADQARLQREWETGEAEAARVYNSAEAQKERDWQTEMSNTAYQRAAADMRAAGLNPASLGGDGTISPASTPSGGAASSSAPSGSAAGASSLGSGGPLGLVTRVAGLVLGRALISKFGHSAQAAKTAAGAVKAVKADVASCNSALATRTAKAFKYRMEPSGDFLDGKYYTYKQLSDISKTRWLD